VRTIGTGFGKPALTGQAAPVRPGILPDRMDRNLDPDIVGCGAQHRGVGHKPRAERNGRSNTLLKKLWRGRR